MTDVDFVSDAKKKHDVPLDHLDFKYVEKCENVKELEKIYRVLASGVEGKYPDLENFVHAKIQKLNPNSRALRKDIPIFTKQALSKKEQELLDSEIWDFVKDIPNVEKKLASKPDITESHKDSSLPPIRSAKQTNIITSSNNTKEAPKKAETTSTTKKSAKPKDYREWEKIEKKIEKELEEPESNESIAKVAGDKTVVNNGKNLSKALVKDLPKEINTENLDEATKTMKADQEKCKGNEAYAAGCYHEALTYYTRSIKYLPNAASYNNRALAYIKLEDWEKAIQDCNEVLKYEKDNLKALLRRATAFHKRKNFDKAKIDIERCLTLDPNDKMAQDLKKKIDTDCVKDKEEKEKIKSVGGNRLKIEETDGSDEESEKEEKPEEPKQRIKIAEVESDDSESEDEETKEVPKQQDVNVPSQDTTKSEFMSKFEPKKLFELPEAVLQAKNKATDLFSNGQYGEAIEQYSKSIDLLKKLNSNDSIEVNMNLSVLYNNRATCYQNICDYKNCIKDCDEGLSIVADNLPLKCKLLHKKAHSLEMNEKYEESFLTYETLMKLDSKFKNVQSSYNRVKNVLNESGKLNKVRSKPVVNESVVKQPETKQDEPKKETQDKKQLYEEYKMRGNDFVKLNNYEKACEFYSKCVDLDPTNTIAYSNRSLCYIKLNKPDLAIKDASYVIEKDLNNIKALYRRALAYREKKAYDLALNDLSKVLSIEPNNQIAKSEVNAINSLLQKSQPKVEVKETPVLIKEIKEETKPIAKEEPKPQVKPQVKPNVPKKEVPQMAPILNIPKKTYDFSSITNGYEFLQAWNSITPTDIDSYTNLLSNVNPDQLFKFIGSKLDDDMLTKLIKSVYKLANENSNLIENKYAVTDYLESIAKTQRFQVTKLFINKELKQMLSVLADKSPKSDSLKKLYGI